MKFTHITKCYSTVHLYSLINAPFSGYRGQHRTEPRSEKLAFCSVQERGGCPAILVEGSFFPGDQGWTRILLRSLYYCAVPLMWYHFTFLKSHHTVHTARVETHTHAHKHVQRCLHLFLGGIFPHDHLANSH